MGRFASEPNEGRLYQSAPRLVCAEATSAGATFRTLVEPLDDGAEKLPIRPYMIEGDLIGFGSLAIGTFIDP